MLSGIWLHNFRSYHDAHFLFVPGSTLVVGSNTAGKTNLMEALWVMATGKSFRANRDGEMICHGDEMARVKAIVGDDELEVMITVGHVGGQKVPHKRYLVNGIPRRRGDFVGTLPAVLFRPEDMNLLVGTPSVRREYLDVVLEQIDEGYRRNLLSYKKGLRQRNKLLEKIREGEAVRSQLIFWDQLLIKTGDIIAHKREQLVEFINAAFRRDKISQVFGGLMMEYDRSVISVARLDHYAHQEVAAGVTLVGPHRDDFSIAAKIRNSKFEIRDLSTYGSRGEQRLAILALKLAELSFVTTKIGERPLLLLDDIFSELDHEHREDVLQVVGQQQTILTTTDLHLVELKYRKQMEVINLAL